MQGRIHDFPEGTTNNLLFGQIFLKTARKERKLDQGGRDVHNFTTVYRSATDFDFDFDRFIWVSCFDDFIIWYIINISLLEKEYVFLSLLTDIMLRQWIFRCFYKRLI